MPPGCGACIGLGRGLVQKGETAISATNRNFKGRMGDRDALVYLGSPAVVAASALAGFICAPTNFTERARRHRHSTHLRRKRRPAASVQIMDGFPSSVRGRVLFIDKDNLNTDGIYGSKHTYRDDMTPEEMAAVTFENYDPNFNTLYQKGDVVVGGLNFGSGSSREQAATALKFKGIPCVIAGSFSETYKRNAFNNGFVVFECPELVTHLRATLTNRAPTTVGPEITIDYAKSILTVDGKSFPFPPLSPAAQELIVAGGAENLVASTAARDRNTERRRCLSGERQPCLLMITELGSLDLDRTGWQASNAHASGVRSPDYPLSNPRSCRLAGRDLADKVAFLWLNTELRGCRATAWATM